MFLVFGSSRSTVAVQLVYLAIQEFEVLQDLGSQSSELIEPWLPEEQTFPQQLDVRAQEKAKDEDLVLGKQDGLAISTYRPATHWEAQINPFQKKSTLGRVSGARKGRQGSGKGAPV